ncbi:MAG: hypothetical protein QOG63_301 [Thermoleophilaceae bacterium]|jgi:hypothetical protein|nr:hypothetical protein [Thermoleophilaceae bacterium]
MMPNSHHLHAAMASVRDDENMRAALRHHELDRHRQRSVPLRAAGRVRRSLARLSLAPLRQA